MSRTAQISAVAEMLLTDEVRRRLDLPEMSGEQAASIAAVAVAAARAVHWGQDVRTMVSRAVESREWALTPRPGDVTCVVLPEDLEGDLEHQAELVRRVRSLAEHLGEGHGLDGLGEVPGTEQGMDRLLALHVADHRSALEHTPPIGHDHDQLSYWS